MAELHPCCDPTSPTAIWEGTPIGRIIEIDGIETYISQPGMRDGQSDSKLTIPAPQSSKRTPLKRIILFLTEGHGIYLPNSQLLADSFASHLDCDVIMPDQFAGQARLDKNQRPFFPPGKEPIPEIEFEAWKGRHEPRVTDPLLARVVKYIHDNYGQDVKIGGVGYCFGGRYVIRLMGSGVIDAGVINHPSFFTMDEVGRLTEGKRLAIYAAETDDILPPEKRRETEDVLTKTGATWMSTVFSGTTHGFSVRGDLSVKEVRLAKECAFTGAVSWFKAWL
ncbi:alpha/beta-hydrolase [Stipitochalara longipes BDJ]|nr:alpha/beta-hydrolase [Stipitochalara longipes BDJ]